METAFDATRWALAVGFAVAAVVVLCCNCIILVSLAFRRQPPSTIPGLGALCGIAAWFITPMTLPLWATITWFVMLAGSEFAAAFRR